MHIKRTGCAHIKRTGCVRYIKGTGCEQAAHIKRTGCGPGAAALLPVWVAPGRHRPRRLQVPLMLPSGCLQCLLLHSETSQAPPSTLLPSLRHCPYCVAAQWTIERDTLHLPATLPTPSRNHKAPYPAPRSVANLRQSACRRLQVPAGACSVALWVHAMPVVKVLKARMLICKALAARRRALTAFSSRPLSTHSTPPSFTHSTSPLSRFRFFSLFPPSLSLSRSEC